MTATDTRYQNRLMVLLSIGFGVVFFDRNAVNFLAPFIAPDLDLSNTQVGLLASGLSLTWAIAGFAVGRLSDSTGTRKPLLIAAVVLFSLCSIVSGLAQSFLVLLASRLLMGLAEGPVLPISQSLIALESSAARRGLNMGVVQNFGSNLLGSFVAPLALVALANHYSWRVAFFVAAVPGLIVAALFVKYVREPARAGSSGTATGASHETRMGMQQMFTYRNLWLCMSISCVMVAYLVICWTFLPLFYVNARSIAASDMSILMSVLGISATLGSIVIPALSDRVGRKPVLIGVCFLGVLVPLGAMYYTGSLLVLGTLVFIGWSANGGFPLFMATIPSETIPARYIATALGLVMGTGEVIGGVLGPLGAGWAADQYGLNAPLYISATCALTGAGLAAFLKETAPAIVDAQEKLSAKTASA